MSTVLLDTHTWVWGLMDSRRLTATAKATIAESETVYLSPISVYEVAQKARVGKWPEIGPHLGTLVDDQQTVSAPFSRAVAARAGTMDWRHRDPFDRLIAATAIELKCPLISKDDAFDDLHGTEGWAGRVWS